MNTSSTLAELRFGASNRTVFLSKYQKQQKKLLFFSDNEDGWYGKITYV